VRVKWLAAALANLDAEAEYIAADNPAAASEMVHRISSAVELLQDHPAIGRIGRVPGTRELIVSGTPYIVPYRVREKSIEVIRVFHAARSWPPSF
jgi:toxin ParE1/3/4